MKDNSGAAVPLSSLNNLSFVMAGPTTDYGYTSFGAGCDDARVCFRERDDGSAVRNRRVCAYTFKHAVPAGARGNFAIGIEGRRTETLLPGTVTADGRSVRRRQQGVVFLSGWLACSAPATVAQVASCNQCHFDLTLHGDQSQRRRDVRLCHNPSNTDAAQRPNATDPAERTKPPQGINFNLLIHRIHTGENLKEAGKSYTVIGRNGSINDFTEVRFPAMSPQGSPGDTRNCAKCHINESQTTPGGVNDVRDPQGFINPAKPTLGGVHRLPRHRGGLVAHAGKHDIDRRELRRVSWLGRYVRSGQTACAILATTADSPLGSGTPDRDILTTDEFGRGPAGGERLCAEFGTLTAFDVHCSHAVSALAHRRKQKE